MREIEFKGYTGRWPNLCRGKLVLRVDGENMLVNCRLISGGSAYIGRRHEAKITQGPWDVEFGDNSFTPQEQAYIKYLVNANVRQGCCGGCI